MKKLLFIIPSLETGGTISSLNSIYKRCHEKWDIYVLPLSLYGSANVNFPEKIIRPDALTELYIANYSTFSGYKKVLGLLIKIIKRLLLVLHVNILDAVCSRTISRIERKISFDTVIGFQEGISTLVASHSISRRKIAWVHCNYDYYIRECPDEDGMYLKFDKVISVSKFTSETLKNRFPTIRDRIGYIYNICNSEEIIAKSKEEIKDKKFDNSLFTIISVGRVNTIKRFREIPKISKELQENGITFRWYVIGPRDETDEWDILMHNITEYKQEHNVMCLGGKRNPYPYFKKADLLVCLSESEACPMIFNEARILGLHVITTDFCSAFEFIESDQIGSISNINNIGKAIAKQVQSVSDGSVTKTETEKINSMNNVIIQQISKLFNN